MPRPVTIAEWTAVRRDKQVHISATLMGNNVRLYQCEESAIAGWCGSIEMPADVLCEIADAYRVGPEFDERQAELYIDG
jgi:hypothetical protein